MKVLNINKYHQLTGGGDRFFFDTARILENNGHEVVPFCLSYPGNDPSPYAEFFPEGVRGLDINSQSLQKKLAFFLRGIYSFEAKGAIAKLIEKVEPDVAHIHVIHYTMSSSVLDALYEARVPIVFSLHDYHMVCANGYLYRQNQICHDCSSNRFYNAVRYRCYRDSFSGSLMAAAGQYLERLRKIYEKVALFTVPHEGMIEELAHFGLDRTRIRILKNPFLTEDIPPSLPVKDHVLFFGQVSRQKGVFTLLEAASRLPHIPFVICGHGPALDAVKALIREKAMSNVRVDDKTRWNSGLKELIASARIVVSPSEWPTPLEYSTLESMWMGKAVVASGIGGNKFVIKDGLNGLIFEPGDRTALQKVIADLYADQAKCAAMGRAAQNLIKEGFSPELFYQTLISIYAESAQQ